MPLNRSVSSPSIGGYIQFPPFVLGCSTCSLGRSKCNKREDECKIRKERRRSNVLKCKLFTGAYQLICISIPLGRVGRYIETVEVMVFTRINKQLKVRRRRELCEMFPGTIREEEEDATAARPGLIDHVNAVQEIPPFRSTRRGWERARTPEAFLFLSLTTRRRRILNLKRRGLKRLLMNLFTHRRRRRRRLEKRNKKMDWFRCIVVSVLNQVILRRLTLLMRREMLTKECSERDVPNSSTPLEWSLKKFPPLFSNVKKGAENEGERKRKLSNLGYV